MKRQTLIWIALAAWVIASAGCATHETKWDAEYANSAVYATQIPLYPGTKIVDSMGSESWGDTPDSYSYGMSWSCETKATREQLVEWYESKLKEAARKTIEDGDGSTIEFSVVPPNAAPHEDMGVWIDEGGKYRVFENTNKKKGSA